MYIIYQTKSLTVEQIDTNEYNKQTDFIFQIFKWVDLFFYKAKAAHEHVAKSHT